jgi:hypothetical protein
LIGVSSFSVAGSTAAAVYIENESTLKVSEVCVDLLLPVTNNVALFDTGLDTVKFTLSAQDTKNNKKVSVSLLAQQLSKPT